MANSSDFQEEKAEHKKKLRQWILNDETTLCNRKRPNMIVVKEQGTYLYYLKTGDREVEVLDRSSVVASIAAMSSKLAEAALKVGLEMTKNQADDCLFMVESLMETNGSDLMSKEPINPIGFKDEPGHCFLRLPIPRMTISADDLEVGIDHTHLGPFLMSIKTNMSDFDGRDSVMFSRLLTAIGALLWDNEPRREIVYWEGKGGEGKTTFCNFLAHKLGRCALPNVKPSMLTKGSTIASFEGIRLVVAEEVGKGRFLNEDLKAITGNRFLTGEAKYKNPRTFRNHSFVWMTSNKIPFITDEAAETERLRWIRSTPRKDGIKRTEADIFEELERYWVNIVAVSIHEYFMAGQRILALTEGEVEELSSNYNMDIDGWIEENFQYTPGAFVPIKLIRRMLTDQREKIGAEEVKARIRLLQPDVCDTDKAIKVGERGRVKGVRTRGITNIAVNTASPSWFKVKQFWSASD